MTGLFLFGIILIVAGIALLVPAIFIGGKVMVAAGVAGILVLLVGVGFVGGMFAPQQVAVTTSAPPAPSVSFKSLSGVTYESASNTLKVIVVLNTTTPAIKSVSGLSGATFKFDAVLNSLANVTTFPSITLSANQAISNTTKAASDDYLFTDYTANSTMAVNVALPNDVVHNDVASSGVTYKLGLTAAGVAQANFTMTLSTQGMMNLNTNSGLGSIVDYTLTIAGQSFTVEVVLVNTVQ